MLHYILGNFHQYIGGGAMSFGREVRLSMRFHSDMEYKEVVHKEGLESFLGHLCHAAL